MNSEIETQAQGGGPAQTDELEDIARQLDDTEVEEQSLTNQLKVNRERHRALTLRAIELMYGLRLGGIVRDKQNKLCRVTEITPSFTGTPWVKGNFVKKDGDWSTVERYLYEDWEVVAQPDTCARKDNGDRTPELFPEVEGSTGAT